jgi:G:T-mismatch repair DNA endonuclease (very short patch repair protein)
VRLKHGRQTTCSRACSYALRADKLSDQVNLTCATCGQDFTRARGGVKGKYDNQFCSSACHYRGRTLGLSKRIVLKPYEVSEAGRAAQRLGQEKARKVRIRRDNSGHTEATRAKLSQANALAIAEGRVPKRSKTEDILAEQLTKRGIRFIHQHPVRNPNGTYACCFDFFLPEFGVVLEVNGTFWHSDPRFYPEGPQSPVQKKNAVAWERKLCLAKTLGIEIREVWEHDLKHCATEAADVALAGLG